MKTSVKFFMMSLVTILALQFAASVSFAAQEAQYKWRFSIPWTRPLLQKGFEDFVERVKQYTDGKVEIKIFPDGLIGNHDESFKSVQAGDTELAMLVPYVSLVPGGALNFMPWTVSSYAGFLMAFDQESGILHNIMTKAYEDVNMTPIFTVASGGYGLANNIREIKTPSDLKNIKFRVSGSTAGVNALGNMGKGTGMTMETIPWSELYNALSRKVIDGCWTTIGLIIAERQYEVLDYYTDLGFMWDAAQVVINKDLWNGLPDDTKKQIEKAAKESMDLCLKLQMDAEAGDIETLKKNGLTPYIPTPAEKEAFFNASNMKVIWDEEITPWLDKAYPGQNMTEKVMDELDKIRKAAEGKR
ncbi:MAG: TRAP transporter substrate-binding protein [Synergistaceae bacterium]|jgi:TRAP-type C4-dicarboxylate transport system substrate-binding protein|nr:TRAP transporter substrate-binding protein [Synergistaceae bacterium]